MSSQSGNVLDFLIKFLSSGFYSGYVPRLAGTLGTFLGLIIYFLMPESPYFYLGLIFILLILGVWLSGKAEIIYKKKDDQRIIIDEVTGYLVSMFLLPSNLILMVMAFVIFRLFDWFKPYPVNIAQKLKGGWGVMADDIMAGVYTCLCLHVIGFIWGW